jgi:hypothetical protein
MRSNKDSLLSDTTVTIILQVRASAMLVLQILGN